MSDCLFCKIANGEIPTEYVYEDDICVAFNDINPEAPFHILIVPKKHIESCLSINDENSFVVGHIFKVAATLAEKFGIDKTGFRLVNNCGKDGGQTVMHLHFHMLAKRNLAWPPG